MHVAIISQLSQYEIGDISAGDLEFERLCRGRKPVPVFPRTFAVCVRRWTDNRPVQPASYYMLFLGDMIGESRA